MKHLRKINEWYKNPEDYLFDTPTEIPVDYTYVDEVFDVLVGIICNEKIVRKGTEDAQNLERYVESYFDNNKEILSEIDKCSNDKKRAHHCAEELYYTIFRNENSLT
jgi:hypothetical protein